MHHTRLRGVALGCVTAAFFAIAPAAMAGTIRYDIPETPAYTIDNEQGIVKVTYNGCVTAGARQTINFAMDTMASNDATVAFKVLKEEGEEPVSSFDPSTVALTKNTDQTFAVALSFTLNEPSSQRTTFRFKLDPENGAGLGQGPGVMVRIPCVLAAPAPGGGFATAPAGDSGAPAQPMPTAGVLAAPSSPLAQRAARCISTPRRVRLRAGERSLLAVRIKSNEQNVRNALVRVTLPGGRAVTRRTGSDGIAQFMVRPTRSGRAVIQSDVCFGASRAAVLAERVVSRRAPARFTG